MTGAGSATPFVFSPEDTFKTLPGTPSYYEPGRNPTIQELELQRALNRQREPNKVWSAQSVAENLEGAFAAEWTIDDARIDDVWDAHFNASGPYTLTSGLASTTRWYTGLQYPNTSGGIATAERELIGCAPIDMTISYTQGGAIRMAVTYIYADEEYGTSITPSNINEANGNTAQFHGLDLTINSSTQVKEQSVELSISNMSRFQRGSKPIAIDAVVGPATASLDLTAIFSETDQIELGYGGTGQTSTSKTMDDVSGSMDLSAGGASFSTISLAKLKPDTYAWDDLINDDANTAESVSFNVDGDPAVSIA